MPKSPRVATTRTVELRHERDRARGNRQPARSASLAPEWKLGAQSRASPRWAVQVEAAVEGGHAVRESAQARAAAQLRAAHAVIGDFSDHAVVLTLDGHGRAPGARVLCQVGERLRDD